MPVRAISSKSLAAGQETPAGTPDPLSSIVGIGELEAIAKGIPLPYHGKNSDFVEGTGKTQLHHHADRDLDFQHGGDAGFADVHRASTEYLAAAWRNRDVHIELEARATPLLNYGDTGARFLRFSGSDSILALSLNF